MSVINNFFSVKFCCQGLKQNIQLLLQHVEHPPKDFFPLLSIKEVCYKSVKATLLSYFPFSPNPPVVTGLQSAMKKMPPLGGLGSKIHPLNKITRT